jgi:hypothetical protein
MTVPFLIVAAGGRAEMRRAVARGLIDRSIVKEP